ncbi:hypothetical protein WICPIJ_006240 [Wickerhamomyces pijperi]|uniref:Uncharacterized protein n=1 Tax=Wickerhamomyces pijperi TaxID=599730 RepID=A0A9P8Q2F3_WICPI|nr:hypothetical protein WICPIJ_006240 [Wickerhamomyces pijperi]
MEFGLLVAATTTNLPESPTPSIKVSSCATTRDSTSPESSELRDGAKESISSMKIIEGWYLIASLKMSLKAASVSPRYLDTIEGPLIVST